MPQGLEALPRASRNRMHEEANESPFVDQTPESQESPLSS